MIKTTRKQRIALARIIERDKGELRNCVTTRQRKEWYQSYKFLRRSVQVMFMGDGAVVVPRWGMWVSD
jgi:hypothetical protein